MKAEEVILAIESRHREDLFLTQVKNGSTWSAGKGELRILDALAIKRSWSAPCFTGYEVKVSRGDFTRDDKWTGYMELCHQFYFACPEGLIKPEELPEEVGLIWCRHVDGQRRPAHSVKRRAKHRPVQISADMLYYILLSRTDSSPSPMPKTSGNSEWWAAWLAGEKDDWDLGWRVKGRLGEKLADLRRQVEQSDRKIAVAESAIGELAEVREIIRQAGISLYGSGWKDQLRRQLAGAMTPSLTNALSGLRREIERIEEAARTPVREEVPPT